MTRFLITYLIVFYSVTVVGFFALRHHTRTHYSKELLEQMITTPSRWRDITDNPCKYSIHGDPLEAKNHFVKLNLICNEGQKTVSTISLFALPDNKLSTILTEYARVLGFDPKIIASWPCFVEEYPVTDFDQLIADKSQIVCHHPDVELKKTLTNHN